MSTSTGEVSHLCVCCGVVGALMQMAFYSRPTYMIQTPNKTVTFIHYLKRIPDQF